MNTRWFTSEAVVLKRFNYGEGDRILTLFTKNYGKISVIAKGVRKPKSRKRGHVELFSHIKVQVVNGGGMGILTEVESISRGVETRSFASLQKPLDRLFQAYQFAELIDRMLPEEEPNQEVFGLLVNSLRALNQDNVESNNLDRYFKNRLIRLLGFWPSERSVPGDIDEYLNGILERPLNSAEIWRMIRV